MATSSKKGGFGCIAVLRIYLALALSTMPMHGCDASALAKTRSPLWPKIDRPGSEVEEQAITWRHDMHQHTDLSNCEFRTSELAAAHLQQLGMEIRVEVARARVTGIIRGAKAGPVAALRADTDALPIGVDD